MASSRHETSIVNSSISRGSEEEFENSCVPCFSDGQHVEAHAFCVECEEYLCNTCLQCHRKTKASRDHQLVIGENMDKHSVSAKTDKIVFEKCAKHKDEMIKFYCKQHDILGCSDCITLNHRTCDLDYLPDKCADISQEYADIMNKLSEKLEAAKAVVKTAEEKDKEIEASYKAVVNRIHEFRHQITDKLDNIQTKDEANAYKNKQKVKDVLTSCSELTSIIENLQTCLKENKTRRENGELFINLKKAKSALESKDVQNAQKSLSNTNTHFTMDCYNNVLQVLLTESFGNLKKHSEEKTPTLSAEVKTPTLSAEVKTPSLSAEVKTTTRAAEVKTPTLSTQVKTPTLSTQVKAPTMSTQAKTPTLSAKVKIPILSTPVKTPILPTPVKTPILSTPVKTPIPTGEDKLKYEGNLYVKTETDNRVCHITACAVLSPYRLVLADWNNCKIKLVNLSTNTVIDEIFAGGQPHDIAALPKGKIAVSIPAEKRINFLSTREDLAIYHSILPQTEFRGISYHADSIYIVCLDPNRITVLDVNGNYKQTISLGFDDLDCITASIHHKVLYITNFCNYPYKNEVVRMTKHGKISIVYRNKKVHGPVGMVELEDGSLLVCCINNKTIHHIDPDFKNGRTVNERVYRPTGIGYNRITRQVYVCQSQTDKLKIFSVQ